MSSEIDFASPWDDKNVCRRSSKGSGRSPNRTSVVGKCSSDESIAAVEINACVSSSYASTLHARRATTKPPAAQQRRESLLIGFTISLGPNRSWYGDGADGWV